MKWIVFLLINVFISTAFGSEEGRRIYLEGKTLDGTKINAVVNGLESRSALSCVNCHRESGLGTSESGITIPPVSWGFLSQEYPKADEKLFRNLQNNRPAYTLDTVHRLLTSGINARGEKAARLMPRYAISRKQTRSLVAYLNTLYVANDAGVDEERIQIATIIDPRLDEAEKQQHISFLKGLVSMKNAGTRGELNRKNNSPEQRKPQYESYRLWDLKIWELPVDTSLWQQRLNEYYEQHPVFVILTPQVKDHYLEVQAFCSFRKLPCLFPHSSKDSSGDYYNFVFRDNDKLRRDYLASRLRKQPGQLIFLNQTGEIKKIKQGQTNIKALNQESMAALDSQFGEICASDKTLILAIGSEMAKRLFDLECPEKQRLNIRLLGEPAMNYEDIGELIKNNDSPYICWVTGYDKVLKRNLREIRVRLLAKKFGIETVSKEHLAQDLYAFGILTDSLHQLAGNFSRPYFMEIMEHMLNSFPNYTYFNSVSGAPGQRAIVGAYKEFCSGNEVS